MPHKSTNRKTFAEFVSHWSLLGAGLAANAGDVVHLESHRSQLQEIVTQALRVLSEQKIQASAKQDLSRQVDVLLDQGTKLATFLRAGVKQHYGNRSEKLVEFDLLPFRGKAQSVKQAKPPVPKAPQPQEDAPDIE